MTGSRVTGPRPARIPAAAARLRLPVWQRSMARMRERFGFDLDSPDALQRVRSLVAEMPTDPDRVLLLAAALGGSGDADLALAQARRAVDLAPEMARAHTTLATLLVTGGEREEGLAHARRAAELDAGDPTVLYNVGLAEWFAGDRRAARTAFAEAERALRGDGSGGASPRGRSWWPLPRRG